MKRYSVEGIAVKHNALSNLNFIYGGIIILLRIFEYW